MTISQPVTTSRLARADGCPVRVLVVDDEPDLADLLGRAFRYEGWDIRTESSGPAAVSGALHFDPDVVVLDRMLPGLDGLEVLRQLRAEDPWLPVLMLTALDSTEDRLAGFAAGADDYVGKPFSLAEVVARVRGLIRQATSLAEERLPPLIVGDIVLDRQTGEVTRDGRTISLSDKEFGLLQYLMSNAQRVLSKESIMRELWKHDFGGQYDVVKVLILALRRKLDTPAQAATGQSVIRTVRGVGYAMAEPGVAV
jgi:two-component system, OmpR family, response regulator